MAAAPPFRWKRWIRRILAALVLVPAILLIAGNILLATPWARGRIAAKISARTGLEAVVGRAACTPWGGVCLGELRLLPPPLLRAAVKQPLLEVREIRVLPRWDRLWRGEIRVGTVRIDRPRLVLPVELAGRLMAAARPAPAVPPAAVIATAETPGAGKARPGEAPAAGPQPPAPVAVSADPRVGTVWMEVNDGSVELWWAGARVLSAGGGEGRIPFAGAPAFASCRLGEFELLGRTVGRDLDVPLSWRAPELRCDRVDLRLAGMQVKLSAVVGLVRGLPFAAELTVPPQRAEGAGYFKTLRPAAERFEVRLQGRGLLRFPASWEGAAGMAAQTASLSMNGETVPFDGARASALLHGGRLQVPDLRLTGDRISFLGNGEIRTDGEGSGVLRVVVPPEIAAAWTARLTRDGRGPVFSRLETPERVFIDLRWVSYPGGQGVELGEGGPVVPAGDLAGLFGGS